MVGYKITYGEFRARSDVVIVDNEIENREQKRIEKNDRRSLAKLRQ